VSVMVQTNKAGEARPPRGIGNARSGHPAPVNKRLAGRRKALITGTIARHLRFHTTPGHWWDVSAFPAASALAAPRHLKKNRPVPARVARELAPLPCLFSR